MARTLPRHSMFLNCKSGALPIVEVFVSIAGSAFASADGTTSWSYRFDPVGLDHGTYTILAYATDSGGRPSALASVFNSLCRCGRSMAPSCPPDSRRSASRHPRPRWSSANRSISRSLSPTTGSSP